MREENYSTSNQSVTWILTSRKTLYWGLVLFLVLGTTALSHLEESWLSDGCSLHLIISDSNLDLTEDTWIRSCTWVSQMVRFIAYNHVWRILEFRCGQSNRSSQQLIRQCCISLTSFIYYDVILRLLMMRKTQEYRKYMLIKDNSAESW